MKNRSTIVATLAGALAGTVIGAGTLYSAQLISVRYETLERSDIQHRATDNRPSEVTRTVSPKHRAASGKAEIYEECEKLSPRRRGACKEAKDRGTVHYTGAQYDEN